MISKVDGSNVWKQRASLRMLLSLWQRYGIAALFTPEGIHILKVMDREETAAYENVSARLMERLRRKEILDKGTGAVLERLKKHGSMLPIRRQWKNCWRKAVQNKPCLRLTDKHTPELCSRILPLLILKLSNGSWKDL